MNNIAALKRAQEKRDNSVDPAYWQDDEPEEELEDE
jgi:hypothetical protein